MRILLFIESGGPGGAEQVIVRLATAFQRRGHDVLVISLRKGWLSENLTANGVRYQQLKSERAFDLSLPFRLARIAKRERAEVLHSHLLDSNFYGALAAKIARIPHVATEHGDIHHTKTKKFLRTKLKLISILGSQFTAVSSFGAAKLQQLGVPSKRVHTIYNPAPEAVELTSTQRTALLESLGCGASFVWIHVANLRPVKDQRSLLQAFALSLQTKGDQKLLLVGDGPERASLIALADTLGIRKNVEFLGFRNDAPELLAIANGFILSSLSESMPLSLIEAAAAGLPIVSTNVGGISEILVSGESAALAPAGDTTALANAITSVVAQPNYAAALGVAARKVVSTKLALTTIIEEYLQLYRNPG